MKPAGQDRPRRDDADPDRIDPIGDVFGLLDDVVALEAAQQQLRQRVDAMTGLRAGELSALLAISNGAEHPRAVASDTGQVHAAAAVTVEALIERGLVGRHHHPHAPAGTSEPLLLHVTDRGAVAVRQAEGIRIRVLDALTWAFGHGRTSELRASMRALAVVLGGPLQADPLSSAVMDQTGTGPPRALESGN